MTRKVAALMQVATPIIWALDFCAILLTTAITTMNDTGTQNSYCSVFPQHGIPVHFISDRDVKFTSNFWQELCKSLKIKLTISTSSHPQTDGQTEQKNDWILQALRHFVAPYQDDWDEHLPKIEFGINDTVNSSTGYTPFYLEYGRHPRSMININMPFYAPTSIKDVCAKYQVIKDCIHDSCLQDKYAAIANYKYLCSPFQYSGPYKIIELVGAAPSCKLALPSDWGVHPVFHPEKLKPYYFDSAKHPLKNQPIAMHAIDKVLSSRVLDGHQQVLIQWQGHHPVYNCTSSTSTTATTATTTTYWTSNKVRFYE
ncbi:hypothetical protein CcCBS67573_g09180 [Chytriomyces confervae]|uniref:Integrase catalytic domain-containing protein n=1 Tax=Chytriomyces confervae TaxID=246404 RepID=A0A507E3F3_9FUNG|nr:hypothetical protein CcCBS67573_g09180 [Chytriomyces confervae]